MGHPPSAARSGTARQPKPDREDRGFPDIFSPMWKVSFCLLVAAAAISVAQDKPEHVEPDIASHNLTKRVDPAIPPLAKAAGIGGTVIADITIDPAGKVSSVALVSGHPMLAPAFIDAVKKWEYTPFVKNGAPVAVITRMEWTVASPKYSQQQEKALHDYYPEFRTCYQMVRQGNDTEAEQKCREAVTLSDQLPDNRVLERSESRVFLGHALYGQHKFLEYAKLKAALGQNGEASRLEAEASHL